MNEEAEPLTPDDQIVLAEETLSGDMRDVMLTHIRAMETPWSKLTENQQADKIYTLTNACETIVRRAVGMVFARDMEKLHVELPQFTIKDEIKGNFTARPTVENIEILAENRGQPAIIVFANVSQLIGEKSTPKPDPDEPKMELEESESEEEKEEEPA